MNEKNCPDNSKSINFLFDCMTGFSAVDTVESWTYVSFTGLTSFPTQRTPTGSLCVDIDTSVSSWNDPNKRHLLVRKLSRESAPRLTTFNAPLPLLLSMALFPATTASQPPFPAMPRRTVRQTAPILCKTLLQIRSRILFQPATPLSHHPPRSTLQGKFTNPL